MSAISDSDAVQDAGRILSQHQAALTLLNNRLQNPDVSEVFWLDVACGKGQIIAQLKDNLSDSHRSKVSYLGYDIKDDFIRTAQKLANDLGLKRAEFLHGDLSNFGKLVPEDKRFDFISCTNTAHEMQPGCFASLFVEALLRLSDNGDLFIYDMESLTKPELGALPWRSQEIGQLVNAAFEVIGSKFRAHSSGWKHSSCRGWSVTIQRNFIGVSNEVIRSKRVDIEKQLEVILDTVLDSRLKECDKALDSYCKFGAETPQDENDKLSALYEFWALHRAKGVRS